MKDQETKENVDHIQNITPDKIVPIPKEERYSFIGRKGKKSEIMVALPFRKSLENVSNITRSTKRSLDKTLSFDEKKDK